MAYDVTVLAHLNITQRVEGEDEALAYQIAAELVEDALTNAITMNRQFSASDIVLVEGVSHEVVA